MEYGLSCRHLQSGHFSSIEDAIKYLTNERSAYPRSTTTVCLVRQWYGCRRDSIRMLDQWKNVIACSYTTITWESRQEQSYCVKVTDHRHWWNVFIWHACLARRSCRLPDHRTCPCEGGVGLSGPFWVFFGLRGDMRAWCMQALRIERFLVRKASIQTSISIVRFSDYANA